MSHAEELASGAKPAADRPCKTELMARAASHSHSVRPTFTMEEQNKATLDAAARQEKKSND
jgi:toxin ParE1/3/4